MTRIFFHINVISIIKNLVWVHFVFSCFREYLQIHNNRINHKGLNEAQNCKALNPKMVSRVCEAVMYDKTQLLDL